MLLPRRRPNGQGLGSSILRAIRALSDTNPGRSLGEARKDADAAVINPTASWRNCKSVSPASPAACDQPQGEAIWGRGADPSQRASLAQRECFQRLRDEPGLGMVIAELIVGIPAMLLDTSIRQATRSSNLQPGLLTNHWCGSWGQARVAQARPEVGGRLMSQEVV